MQELVDRIGLSMLVQIAVESWNELFLLILLLTMLVGIQCDKSDALIGDLKIPMTRELVIYYAAILVYNLCDILDLISGGGTDGFSYWGIRCGVFCYYAVGGFQTVFFLQVVKKYIADELGKLRLRRILTGFQILQIPLFCLLAVTPFTNALYQITPENEYMRSWGYHVWQGVTILTFLFIGSVIIMQWRRIEFFLKSIIITATVFPAAGLIGGLFTQVSLNNIMGAVTALLLFLHYEKHKTALITHNAYMLEKTRRELAESRIALMMAQIKPHFINNTLAVIQELCYEEPKQASDLIGHFARYLRKNIEATSGEELVEFAWELSAIREYLEVESADREKQFRFSYELGCMEFAVPPLSIEPLVENAVKHGIDRYDPESCVVLATYPDGDAVCIEVRDNGKGFDLNDETLGKGGIGLKNARVRLEQLCGGSLDICRENGWTVIRIRLPGGAESTTDPADG